MSLTITIDYRPALPVRKGTTKAIASALRTLAANPRDEKGDPGSFVVPLKFRGSVRIAARDVGVEVKTVAVDEGVRVYLRSASLLDTEKTMTLPGIE